MYNSVYFANSLPSTSTITGAVKVLGGVGIGGNVNVGGDITATGNVSANYLIGNGSQITGISGLGLSSQGADPSNWNTNVTLGLYSVNRTSWSGTVGTPTDAYTVGLLQVLVGGQVIVQKYQPNDTSSEFGAEFVRTNVLPNGWTSWSRTIGETGLITGGTF